MLLCFVFRHLEDPMQTLEAMLRPKVATLPGHIQAVYVQNAAKLFSTLLQKHEGTEDTQVAQEAGQLLIERLPVFVQSANLEVQERVRPELMYIIIIIIINHVLLCDVSLVYVFLT